MLHVCVALDMLSNGCPHVGLMTVHETFSVFYITFTYVIDVSFQAAGLWHCYYVYG